MGTLALGIALGTIVTVGLLLLLVRRQIAQGDRREFGSSDSGGVIGGTSDSVSAHAGNGCDFGTGGDCGGGDGGGGGD